MDHIDATVKDLLEALDTRFNEARSRMGGELWGARVPKTEAEKTYADFQIWKVKVWYNIHQNAVSEGLYLLYRMQIHCPKVREVYIPMTVECNSDENDEEGETAPERPLRHFNTLIRYYTATTQLPKGVDLEQLALELNIETSNTRHMLKQCRMKLREAGKQHLNKFSPLILKQSGKAPPVLSIETVTEAGVMYIAVSHKIPQQRRSASVLIWCVLTRVIKDSTSRQILDFIHLPKQFVKIRQKYDDVINELYACY